MALSLLLGFRSSTVSINNNNTKAVRIISLHCAALRCLVCALCH